MVSFAGGKNPQARFNFDSRNSGGNVVQTKLRKIIEFPNIVCRAWRIEIQKINLLSLYLSSSKSTEEIVL